MCLILIDYDIVKYKTSQYCANSIKSHSNNLKNDEFQESRIGPASDLRERWPAEDALHGRGPPQADPSDRLTPNSNQTISVRLTIL